MTKICSKCRIEKSSTEFHRDNSCKGGLRLWCKTCQCAYRAAYRKTPKGQALNRKWAKSAAGQRCIRNSCYKISYGQEMTVDKYNEMLTNQIGLCLICGQPEKMIVRGTGRVRKLDIDHDHKTKRIRGLLCHHCNLSLSFAEKYLNKINHYLIVGV